MAWLTVSLLPIFIKEDYRKAASSNLLTFFVLNFFVYVFLFGGVMRVTSEFFAVNFVPLIWNSIILGFTIIFFSILISFLLKKLKSTQLEKKKANLLLDEKPLIVCTKCGTKFNSIPLYCFNCNTKLTSDELETNE
jgi:hypothetical protein